jgi:capsular exopolysaccharide synthesis family protein
MIIAGPSVPNPTEILDNHFFDEMLTKLRSRYDLIILDAPPLGLVIDPAVIAPKCDGAILVIEQGKISRKFVQNVKRQLENSGVRILGAVLNKVQENTSGYYKKYYKGDYYEERE